MISLCTAHTLKCGFYIALSLLEGEPAHDILLIHDKIRTAVPVLLRIPVTGQLYKIRFFYVVYGMIVPAHLLQGFIAKGFNSGFLCLLDFLFFLCSGGLLSGCFQRGKLCRRIQRSFQ